jgi:hypothetical protein
MECRTDERRGRLTDPPILRHSTRRLPRSLALFPPLATAALLLGLFLPRLTAAPLPPANDFFANRTVITVPNLPSPIVFTNQSVGRNTGATKEAGEPEHVFNPGGKSVWWTWTAPANGDLRLTTDQSTFDTLLAVYTGTSVSNLTLVGANDDHAAEKTSRLRLSVRAGTAYQIAVDGYSNPGAEADAGNLKLFLTFFGEPLVRPPNDSLANAAIVSGIPVNTTGANVNATREPGEPDHAGESGDTSVWWSWTAPASGNFVVSTEGSNFDTLLAVYRGASLGALTFVAANDDADRSNGIVTSQLAFNAVAGTTYRIAVDGFDGASGAIALRIGSAAPVLSGATMLPNRAFRLTITGPPGSTNQIMATTNFAQWIYLGAVVNTSGVVTFTDSTAANWSRRAYRAVVVP